MITILKVIILLCSPYIGGYGITGYLRILSKDSNDNHGYFLIVPVIGYCFSQLLFWISYYFSERSLFSLWVTISILLLINITFIFFVRRNKSLYYKQSGWSLAKKYYPLLLILLLILILSSWQYLILGQGHYFHSANEDIFDGITGGQSYIVNTPLSYMPEDFSGWIRLQYSSQTFTRLLLGVSGIDGFCCRQF
jgi:hypothetical protein